MRHIHPVGISEVFIASGKYIHHADGQPTGAFEAWSMHELPDGARMIRVDRDARAVKGHSILIEAYRDPDGQIDRVDISAFGQADDAVKRVRATYSFHADRVEIGRTLDDQPRVYEERSLPGEYVILPGSLLLMGMAVVNAAEHANGAPIVTIDQDMKPDTALQAYISTLNATKIGTETISISDKSYNATHYECNPQPHLWVDKYGVLLRQGRPDHARYITITNYARRPD